MVLARKIIKISEFFYDICPGPSRGGKRGKVFPGPATFGGPVVAQKY